MTDKTSEEVLHLVRTVERLPREDQEKFLHIVDLLSLVPVAVQDQTQQMLHALLESEPESKMECTAAIDAVIDYLERHTLRGRERRGEAFAATEDYGGRARVC